MTKGFSAKMASGIGNSAGRWRDRSLRVGRTGFLAGLAIAAGGATEKFGVTPDMVTLAKVLGGGLPSGAIGGSTEVMSVVEDHTVYQVGTYNGNPLSMAAAKASSILSL